MFSRFVGEEEHHKSTLAMHELSDFIPDMHHTDPHFSGDNFNQIRGDNSEVVSRLDWFFVF